MFVQALEYLKWKLSCFDWYVMLVGVELVDEEDWLASSCLMEFAVSDEVEPWFVINSDSLAAVAAVASFALLCIELVAADFVVEVLFLYTNHPATPTSDTTATITMATRAPEPRLFLCGLFIFPLLLRA